MLDKYDNLAALGLKDYLILAILCVSRVLSMAILSKKMMTEVARAYSAGYGLKVHFTDVAGNVRGSRDELSILANSRRRRNYALQESINLGEPYVFNAVPGVATWVIALEDRRRIHGGMIGGEVIVDGCSKGGTRKRLEYLAAQGMPHGAAQRFLARLPRWSPGRVDKAAVFLQETFYQISGWQPELMTENRLKTLQQAQISQAIEDQRKSGIHALYAFEKERKLLANIRAGDRNGARQILNEMLATIYMSSPKLVVLRARAVELMSCLTRAAIEDNPLMEPLVERNHRWTEQLIVARDFDDLSHVLMAALDDFIDGIYLHGVNRSNVKVHRALDFISQNFAQRLTLRTVAGHVGLSPCRTAHLIREFTGSTVLQIIQQVRIRHAQELLKRTSKSCTEIAYDVGYEDQSYFIKHFKRITGATPVAYRRKWALPLTPDA